MITWVLIAIIAGQSILHHVERRDLYNRLMSKDFKEYKNPSDVIKKRTVRKSKAGQKWREGGKNK